MRILFTVLTILSIFSLSMAFGAEERIEKIEPQIFVEKGGYFDGKRTLVIEPGFEYTHISSNRLDISGFTLLPTIVIGNLQVEKIRRDIMTPSLTLRFGLFDRVEFNVRIPYLARHDRYVNTVGTDRVDTRVDENGFGDIEGGFLVHVIKENGSVPEVVAGLKVKSRIGKDPYGLASQDLGSGIRVPSELPLGSGHWAIEPSLTFITTADPALLFFNLSYFSHLKRDLGNGLGTVDPSDSINYSFGLAYALSDKLALSSSFEQKIFSKAEIDNKKVPETDITIASLTFGGTFVLSDRRNFSVSVGFGLTPDSPDVQVGLKMPIKYKF